MRYEPAKKMQMSASRVHTVVLRERKKFFIVAFAAEALRRRENQERMPFRNNEFKENEQILDIAEELQQFSVPPCFHGGR
jgi:hypothetical protein